MEDQAKEPTLVELTTAIDQLASAYARLRAFDPTDAYALHDLRDAIMRVSALIQAKAKAKE